MDGGADRAAITKAPAMGYGSVTCGRVGKGRYLAQIIGAAARKAADGRVLNRHRDRRREHRQTWIARIDGQAARVNVARQAGRVKCHDDRAAAISANRSAGG